MIAHRLSTVVDADVILVVHDGKIIEQGTPEELYRLTGLDRNNIKQQIQ